MHVKTFFHLVTQDVPEVICSKVEYSPREISEIEGYHNICMHGGKANVIVWEMNSEGLENQIPEVIAIAEKLHSVSGDRHVSCHIIREAHKVNEFYGFLSAEILKKYSSLNLELNFEYIE